jgi:hypothetical protein
MRLQRSVRSQSDVSKEENVYMLNRALVMLLLLLLIGASPVAAQDKTVGGHTAVFVPLVNTGGPTTVTPADQFTIGFPTGISVKGTGRMFFDFEFVPLVVADAPRGVDVVIHPGLIWSLPHNFAAGVRLAYHTSSPQFGFTPILIKSWPIQNSFFKAYFLEFDFPVRFVRPANGPASNTFTFGLHFGVGF